MDRTPSYSVYRLEVEVANRGYAWLELYTATQEAVLLRRLVGRRGVKIGDEPFDRRFYVERNLPEGFAAKLFAADHLRQRMLTLLTGPRRRRLELNGQRLTLEETLPWFHLQSVSRRVDYLQDLIELLIDLGKAVDALDVQH